MPEALIAAGPPRSRVTSAPARAAAVVGWSLAVLAGVLIWVVAYLLIS